MNDYRSEEYRLAKYLRSSSDYVDYFKRHRESSNRIGHGSWNYIEYVDELVENHGNNSIYYIKAGELILRPQHPIFEPAVMITMPNAVLYNSEHRVAALSEVQNIEDTIGKGYYLKDDIGSSRDTTWTVYDLPIVFHPYNILNELFFNQKEALEYGRALTEHLRYNIEAVSAFTRYI
jgi:hypothetical protein